ncbi:MAG: (2Fe-2S)-binding protein [Ignavibacteriae bacterium]|nr:(2Fe-2S)-binding protein [Ignavibacteriota bacterium]
MPVLTLVNEDKTIEVAEGENLRQVLLKNGISPYKGIEKALNCFGNGLCGTCRVEIVDGKNAPSLSPQDELMLAGLLPFYARKVGKHVRLSCKTKITKDLEIKTYPPVEMDKQLTKERLTLTAIWSLFGGVFLFVVTRMLIEIATGR